MLYLCRAISLIKLHVSVYGMDGYSEVARLMATEPVKFLMRMYVKSLQVPRRKIDDICAIACCVYIARIGVERQIKLTLNTFTLRLCS